MKPVYAVLIGLLLAALPFSSVVADNDVPPSYVDLVHYYQALDAVRLKAASCEVGLCTQFSCADAKALQKELEHGINVLRILLTAHQQMSDLYKKRLGEIQQEAEDRDPSDKEWWLGLSQASGDAGKILLDVVAIADGVQVLRHGLAHGVPNGKLVNIDQVFEELNELSGLLDDINTAYQRARGNKDFETLRPKFVADKLELKSNATDFWHALKHLKQANDLSLANPHDPAIAKQLDEEATNLELVAGRLLSVIAEHEQEKLREEIADEQRILASLDVNYGKVYDLYRQVIEREGAIQQAISASKDVYYKSAADCWSRCKLDDSGMWSASTDLLKGSERNLSPGDLIKKYSPEIENSAQAILNAAGRFTPKGGVKPTLSALPVSVMWRDLVNVKYQVAVCAETEGARIRRYGPVGGRVTLSESDSSVDLGTAARGSESSLQFAAPMTSAGESQSYQIQLYLPERPNPTPRPIQHALVPASLPIKVLAEAPLTVGAKPASTQTGRLEPKPLRFELGNDKVETWQKFEVIVSPAYSVSPNGTLDVAFNYASIWNTWWKIFQVQVRDLKGKGSEVGHDWLAYPEQQVKEVRATYDAGSAVPVHPNGSFDALLTAPKNAHRLSKVDVVFATPEGDQTLEWNVDVKFP